MSTVVSYVGIIIYYTLVLWNSYDIFRALPLCFRRYFSWKCATCVYICSWRREIVVVIAGIMLLFLLQAWSCSRCCIYEFVVIIAGMLSTLLQTLICCHCCMNEIVTVVVHMKLLSLHIWNGYRCCRYGAVIFIAECSWCRYCRY